MQCGRMEAVYGHRDGVLKWTKWRLTRQYTAVADKVNSEVSLSQALQEANLNSGMFQRRRVIAEAYLALPDAVKNSLMKHKCGSLESIYLQCRIIAKTAKGKSKIKSMAMNGLILPIRIWIQWFILFGNEYIIEWICKFIYFTLIFLPYRVIHFN